jgi:hypothetical protein
MLSPCGERFEDMKDGHCARCNKTVVDLCGLEEDEALEKIREGICARVVRHRATGRLVFGAAAVLALGGCSSGVFSGPPTKCVTLVVPYREAGPKATEEFETMMGDVRPTR